MTVGSWWTRFAEASLALRMAVAVALFGLAVAFVAAAFGYWALARQLDARVGSELDGKRALLRHVLSEIPNVAQVAESKHRFGDLLIGHRHLHLSVIDPHGSVIASFSPVAAESIFQVRGDAADELADFLRSRVEERAA